MDKSKTTTVLAIILAVFLVATIIGQIIVIPQNACKTEVARLYELTDTIKFDGVLIRDEHTVERSYNGVLQYEHEDGSRLAKNSVIASVYASSSDIDVCQKIDKLNERIKTLEEAQKLAGTDGSQAEAFGKLITEKHNEIVTALNDKDYKKAESLKYELLGLQSKRDIAKGRAEDYESVISELKNEVNSLSARISSTPQTLISGETGYFVSNTDGYESELSVSASHSLTPSDIEAIVKAPKKSDGGGTVIGKMIDNYKWKLAAVLDDHRASLLSTGETVRLLFNADNSTIEVTVEYIHNYDGEGTVVVFAGDTLSAELASSRTGRFELVVSRYSGIRLPSSAIRFNEKGEKGVYILYGNLGYFRTIEELYSGEDFVIIKHIPNNQTNYLDLYDNVIVEGKFEIYKPQEESRDGQSST